MTALLHLPTASARFVHTVSSSTDESSQTWSVYRATSPSGKVYIGVTSKTLKKAAAIPVVRSDGMVFPTLTAAAKSVDVAVSTMMLAVRDGRRINDFHFAQANCSKQVR